MIKEWLVYYTLALTQCDITTNKIKIKLYMHFLSFLNVVVMHSQ